MEPREPVVTYNGEDRSEAELRAVVGACFLCLRHFETMPYFAPRFMPPLRGSHLIFVAVSRGSAPYGAPPPGYFIPPLRGSEFRSPAARKIFPPSPPSTSDLPGNVPGVSGGLIHRAAVQVIMDGEFQGRGAVNALGDGKVL